MNGAEYILGSYPNVKKIALFHSHTLWPSHFETDLELMELLGRKDVDLVSYVCNDVLEYCDVNKVNDLNKCARCIKIRHKGFSVINKNTLEIAIELKKVKLDIDPSLSIDEIKRIKYNGFDVGYATLSTIVSRYRDPYITVEKYHRDFTITINKAIALYNFFLESLSQVRPDFVIIFNGRYAYSRALVRACEKLGIPYCTHERGSSFNRYMIFPNTLPHDLDFFHQAMIQKWKSQDITEEDKIRQADAFYHDRVAGRVQNWFPFITSQDHQLLPDNWDINVYNIAIFLSSEDEFIAIGDQWEQGLFKNQLAGLEYLKANIPDSKAMHLYIRCHPNSKNAHQFIKKLEQLNSGMITVILPESSISTYKLMFSANKVLTFGSTIGIEATYWGKASINLGNCFYKVLGVTYNPEKPEDVIDFILDKKLEPLDKYPSYLYAYYINNFGYEFEIYKSTGLMAGTINTVNLQKTKGLKSRLFTNYFKRPTRLRHFFRRLELKFWYVIEIKFLKLYK